MILDLLADFEDFKKVSVFIKSQTNEAVASNEAFMKYSKKCNLFSFILMLKAGKMTNSLSSLMNETFQHFSKNIKDNYSLLNLLFIKDIGNSKFFEIENENYPQNFDQEGGGDNLNNQKTNLNLNMSSISLKVNSNADESFMTENEKEGDFSKESIKLRNRSNTGAIIDIKKTLNFNENVLECLLNFFKILMAYSGSFLR